MSRKRISSIRALKALQRERLNNVTPVAILVGHWGEIFVWCALISRLPLIFAPVAACVIAIKFRHLQELSHFAIHRCLTKSGKLGDSLIEIGFQAPLLMTIPEDRRQKHVVEHHPNATVIGVDPNIEDLRRGGITPGCTSFQFILGVIFPITARGLAATASSMTAVIWQYKTKPIRNLAFISVVVAIFTIANLRGIIFGLILPRFLLYPLAAWLSLIFEHRWFAPTPRSGSRRPIEAGRCIRLYKGRPLLESVARATWLPYGDLLHFAHSAYPAIRWNYLGAVDRIIGEPDSVFRSGFFGGQSAILTLFRDVSCVPELSDLREQECPQRLPDRRPVVRNDRGTVDA